MIGRKLHTTEDVPIELQDPSVNLSLNRKQSTSNGRESETKGASEVDTELPRVSFPLWNKWAGCGRPSHIVHY